MEQRIFEASVGDLQKYSGMTVNERLFSAGLMIEFENACKVRDRANMIGLLNKVELEDQSAIIVDKILKDPGFYGY